MAKSFPGPKPLPWHDRESWQLKTVVVLTSAGILAQLGKALWGGEKADWFAFVAAFCTVSSLAPSVAKWVAAKKKEDKQEKKHEGFTPLLHVIDKSVRRIRKVADDPWAFRVTIYRRIDDETLEQAANYVGGDFNGLGRRRNAHEGGLGLVVGDASRKPFVLHRTAEDFEAFVKLLKLHGNLTEKSARAVRSDRWSFIAVPLVRRSDNRVIGVLYADTSKKNCFTETIVDFITDLAPHIVDHYATEEQS